MSSGEIHKVYWRVLKAAFKSLSPWHSSILLSMTIVAVLMLLTVINFMLVVPPPPLGRLALAVFGVTIFLAVVFVGQLRWGSRQGLELIRVAFRLTKQKKKEEAFFVSERYAEEINSKVMPACTILGVCFLYAVLTNDYIAAGIVGVVVVAIVGYGWLTKLRAQNGWLADNQYEVLELLHFIISKSKSGGLPPGSRVSRHASEVVQVRTSLAEEVVGSRA